MTTLHLLSLRPDLAQFSRWAVARGLLHSGVDDGYAWHALLASAFGELAPKPFAVRECADGVELLGYCQMDPQQAIGFGQDSAVLDAIAPHTLQVRTLPMTWEAGLRLSYQVRVRPVVRSRGGRGRGNAKELDAAIHARQTAPDIQRMDAYGRWLAAECARDGASQLESMRPASYCRSKVLRKGQGSGDGSRPRAAVEGPDLTATGQLTVADSGAFSQLLARGVGRHRAFGFGCLLIAPPGVLG
ncbi:type I-E CRISPR-associated protein Cas6/Cse3/CasE [bacterium]|nr:type I-E CRISPR-associated protein Cas6/Cse3/CasE [bacterium]